MNSPRGVPGFYKSLMNTSSKIKTKRQENASCPYPPEASRLVRAMSEGLAGATRFWHAISSLLLCFGGVPAFMLLLFTLGMGALLVSLLSGVGDRPYVP